MSDAEETTDWTAPTEMVHYECQECVMEATGVVTDAMGSAWLEHMESHGPLGQYNAWAWTVVPLRFSMDEPAPFDD